MANAGKTVETIGDFGDRVLMKINKKESLDEVKEFLKCKQKTDICLFFHQATQQYSVMNREEMQSEMRRWKPMAKAGLLKVLEANKQSYTVKNKTLYTFVLTPTDPSLAYVCPLSLALSTIVHGMTYAFTKEQNRDDVFEYLYKYIKNE